MHDDDEPRPAAGAEQEARRRAQQARRRALIAAQQLHRRRRLSAPRRAGVPDPEAGPATPRQQNPQSDDYFAVGKLLESVASGAIGGLDILRTGGRAGLSRGVYRGVKPPAAWKGSPAEDAVDLDALTEPTVFFEGDAAEASARPKGM